MPLAQNAFFIFFTSDLNENEVYIFLKPTHDISMAKKNLSHLLGSQKTCFMKLIEIISVSVFAAIQLILVMESPDY